MDCESARRDEYKFQSAPLTDVRGDIVDQIGRAVNDDVSIRSPH